MLRPAQVRAGRFAVRFRLGRSVGATVSRRGLSAGGDWVTTNQSAAKRAPKSRQ
jgi:hypothetical protein